MVKFFAKKKNKEPERLDRAQLPPLMGGSPSQVPDFEMYKDHDFNVGAQY